MRSNDVTLFDIKEELLQQASAVTKTTFINIGEVGGPDGGQIKKRALMGQRKYVPVLLECNNYSLCNILEDLENSFTSSCYAPLTQQCVKLRS